MKVEVLDRQTLVDIAIQVYGSAEGVFTLAQENGMSVTDSITPGQTLTYSQENIIDKMIVEKYTKNNVKPATAFQSPEIIFDSTFDNTFRSFSNEQNN